MLPQDMIKLCYQATHGPEHLLSDLEMAKHIFDKEFSDVSNHAIETDQLYECISQQYCRVSLPVWREKGLPGEWLFRMFADTAKKCTASKQGSIEVLFMEVESLLNAGDMPFQKAEWMAALTHYRESGGGAVHHS
jgi:hypothetical protein